MCSLLLVFLVLWMGCASETGSPHTIVVVQDKYIIGALNVRDVKQGKQLTKRFLDSFPRSVWTIPQLHKRIPLRKRLPDSIGTWRVGEDVRLYHGRQLMEHLTGSQLFLDYGFVEMVSTVYYEKYLGKDPLLQVDLYDMDTPINAFGIYSLQRNLQARRQGIGAEAIITDESLDAWKGRYYLKIQAWNIADAISEGMVRIAQEIFRRIDESADLSALLGTLPADDKFPGTERVFHTYRALDQITLVPTVDVLQLSQNTNGLLAEYRNKGSKLDFDTLILFGVEYPNPEKAAAAFEFYRTYIQQQGQVENLEIGTMSFIGLY